MQKPSIGRIVIVPVDPRKPGTNGQTEAPAIITGVFEYPTHVLVNVRVVLDGDGFEWRTSQSFADEKPEGALPGVAWWPARV
jgi:hypothetical protein